MRGKERESGGCDRAFVIGGIESGEGPLIPLLQLIAALLIDAIGAAEVGISCVTVPLLLNPRHGVDAAGKEEVNGDRDRARHHPNAEKSGAMTESLIREDEAIAKIRGNQASETGDTAQKKAAQLGHNAHTKAAVSAKSNVTHLSSLVRN